MQSRDAQVTLSFQDIQKAKEQILTTLGQGGLTSSNLAEAIESNKDLRDHGCQAFKELADSEKFDEAVKIGRELIQLSEENSLLRSIKALVANAEEDRNPLDIKEINVKLNNSTINLILKKTPDKILHQIIHNDVNSSTDWVKNVLGATPSAERCADCLTVLSLQGQALVPSETLTKRKKAVITVSQAASKMFLNTFEKNLSFQDELYLEVMSRADGIIQRIDAEIKLSNSILRMSKNLSETDLSQNTMP